MTERTRGEVVREVFTFAKAAQEPHEVARHLRESTLPYFRGDFREMVSALETSHNGPSYQGARPDIWDSIRRIDGRAPFLGTALSTLAINENIEPPACGLQARGLTIQPS